MSKCKNDVGFALEVEPFDGINRFNDLIFSKRSYGRWAMEMIDYVWFVAEHRLIGVESVLKFKQKQGDSRLRSPLWSM